MKRLIKLAVLVVIAVVAYNYFFGTSDEKSKAETFIKEVKDVFTAGKDIILDEKDKVKEGKYDEVISRIKNALEGARDRVEGTDTNSQQELRDLLEDSDRLEEVIKELDKGADQEDEDIAQKLNELLDRANDYFDEKE